MRQGHIFQSPAMIPGGLWQYLRATKKFLELLGLAASFHAIALPRSTFIFVLYMQEEWGHLVQEPNCLQMPTWISSGSSPHGGRQGQVLLLATGCASATTSTLSLRKAGVHASFGKCKWCSLWTILMLSLKTHPAPWEASSGSREMAGLFFGPSRLLWPSLSHHSSMRIKTRPHPTPSWQCLSTLHISRLGGIPVSILLSESTLKRLKAYFCLF